MVKLYEVKVVEKLGERERKPWAYQFAAIGESSEEAIENARVAYPHFFTKVDRIECEEAGANAMKIRSSKENRAYGS